VNGALTVMMLSNCLYSYIYIHQYQNPCQCIKLTIWLPAVVDRILLQGFDDASYTKAMVWDRFKRSSCKNVDHQKLEFQKSY